MSRDLGIPVVSQGEYCFISYNAEDYKRAGKIVKRLHQVGIPMWYDKGIDYGSNYHAVIAEKIDSCRCVLLLFSKKILEKGEGSYVFTEYEMAKMSKKPIYVVMLDEIVYPDVPFSLRAWYIALNKLQNINAYEYPIEKTIQEIVYSLPFTPQPCAVKDKDTAELKDPSPEKESGIMKSPPAVNSAPDKKATDEALKENTISIPPVAEKKPDLSPENLNDSDKSDTDTESQKEGNHLPKSKSSFKKKIAIIAGIIFIAGIIAVLFVLFVLRGGKCGENITWALNNEGILTISGTGDMYDYSDNAPWIRVTKNITKIIFNGDIKTIGEYAFEDLEQVTEITLPDNLASIGHCAFSSCTALKSISIPDSVKEIGDFAFSNNRSLSDVKLSENIEIISKWCFFACHSLKSITIPASVKMIKDGAFYNCDKLEKIVFAGSTPPDLCEDCFKNVKATIYYPANSPAWEEVVNKYHNGMQTTWNDDGELTWIAY